MTQKTGFIPQFDNDDLRRVVKAGHRARANHLHAVSVRYIEERDGIKIVLEKGVVLFMPRTEIKEFVSVAPAQMSSIRLSLQGTAIELEAADVDIDVGGLVADLVPARELASALARHGRKSTSEEQAEAVRRNATKGGRPKKRTTHTEEILPTEGDRRRATSDGWGSP